MPSAPAPFVSFNDYLDANSGSLATERGQVLGQADTALGALGADVQPMKDAAYAQGADQAKASWSAQRAPSMGADGKQVKGATSSDQYKAPTADVNFSTLPGQEKYATDKATAESTVNAIGQGGLGLGKGAFEAGMIGADQSYHEGAASRQKSYQDSVNGYLDSIKGAAQEGANSFKPAPIVTTQPVYEPPSGGGPGEGPVNKPHRTGTRKIINGVEQPMPGEEQP